MFGTRIRELLITNSICIEVEITYTTTLSHTWLGGQILLHPCGLYHMEVHLTHWGREKWTPFSRQHFQMHYLQRKWVNFYQNFTEVLFLGVQLKYATIGLDNGLTPTRRQAIIWTNDGKCTDAYMWRLYKMAAIPKMAFSNASSQLIYPRQIGDLFADVIFTYIFMNEKFCISIQISLKFVPKGPINNKSALVQVMAWHKQVTSRYLNQDWPSSTMHICSTRVRWVKWKI